MPRRKFTPAQRARVVRYALAHTRAEACRKYGIVTSVVARWLAAESRPRKAHRRANGAMPPGREVVLLLRKAMSLIDRDLAAGTPLREADAYVKLALVASSQTKDTHT